MTAAISARLVARDQLSVDTCWLTFEAVDGAFAGMSPGAHVDLHLGGDLRRSYSLTDWSDDGTQISVAVKREPEGRGGSVAAHALGIGDVLPIAGPRNNFALEGDGPVVLLGGGIGVTPIYAMAKFLAEQGRDFEVRYYVRGRDLAAFDTALTALDLGDRYTLHCDDVDGLPDFWDLLEARPADTRYYVCGPEVMLNAVEKTSEELERGTVVFERFAAVPGRIEGDHEDHPFEVVLSSTGEAHTIPSDSTILQVLRSAGHDVDYACGEGTCGTCILDVVEGEVDHRDSILTDEEKAVGDCLCICVSRARGSRLVLEL